MAVVINEFEVITGPSAPAGGGNGGGAASGAGGGGGAGPTPHDIERVMRREAERLARVRAH